MKTFPRSFGNSVRIVTGCVLLGLVAAVGSAHGEALLIGYTNCQAVAQYPAARMNEIAQFKWYFAHASVGGNLMSGIADLRGASSTFYPIQAVYDDANPPATTLPGRVYSLQSGSQLQPGGFTNFLTNIASTPPWNTQSVNLPSGPAFFRLLVRQ
jgi:hypothetical protein